MAITVTIGGVDKTAVVQIAGLQIQMNYRSSWTAAFTTVDPDSTASGYRPALDAAVVIADGVVVKFRGWIFGIRDDPITPPRKGTRVQVSCRAYDALLDAIVVRRVYGTDPNVIANSSVANPTSLTTAQPHGLTTGALVIIEDHVGGVAAVNGTHVITVTSHSTLTIPINNTTSGGGGTIRQVYRANTIVTDLHSGYLTARGVSIDTLADAPILSKQVFDGVTLRSAFDHIQQVTGWILRITPEPRLEFFAPGTKTASYSLTATNRLNVGPVTWEQSRQRYANKILLRFGSDSVVAKTDTFTGDGSTNVWALKYTPALDPASGLILSTGYVIEHVVTPVRYPLALLSDITTSSVGNPTTITTRTPHGFDVGSTHSVKIQSHTGSTPAINGDYVATITGTRTFTVPVNVTVAGTGGSVYGNGYVWLYYSTLNLIFRVGALASEVLAEFAYSAQFPDTVTAVDGAGDWEATYEAPDIFDVYAAQALADGILRRELAKPKTVTTQTRQVPLIMPGTTMTMTFTDKTISGSLLIQSVTITADADKVLRSTLTAVTGTEFKDTAEDIFRDALGSGGLQASGGTISGAAVPLQSGVAADNMMARAGTTYEVEAGNVTGNTLETDLIGLAFGKTNRWLLGLRPAQSPGASGYEMALFDTRLSSLYPIWRWVDDTTNVILALNAVFTTTVRGVQLGEDATGKRFAAIHALNGKFIGTFINQGAEVMSGVLSPAQITATQHNYAPAGIFNARILRLTSNASQLITGITTITNGNLLTLMNVGSADIVLQHDNGADSTAGNRFLCPNGGSNLTLQPHDSVDIWADQDSARWRVLGH